MWIGWQVEEIMMGLLFSFSSMGRSRRHQWERIGKRSIFPLILLYAYALAFSFTLGMNIGNAHDWLVFSPEDRVHGAIIQHGPPISKAFSPSGLRSANR